MRYKLEAKNPLTENVRKYLETFGHLPSIEAMKFYKPEDIDELAKQALEKGEPIKSWKNRSRIQTGTSLDDFY